MIRDGYQSSYSLKRIPFGQIFGIILGTIGVLVLSRFLTGFVLRFDPYYIYVAAVAIVLAVVVSQRFEFALWCYALLAPLSIGASPGFEGTRSGFRPVVMPSQMGLLLLGGIWLAMGLFKRRPLVTRCSLYLPFLSFLFVCVLSILSTYVTWDFDIPLENRRLINQVSEVALFVLILMAFWIASSTIAKRQWIPALFWPMVITGSYNAVCLLTRIDPPIYMVRGSFMTAFATAMVLARVLFAGDRKSVRVGLWLLALALTVALFFDLGWISGWLTAGVASAVLIAYRSRTAFAVLAAIAFVVLFIYPGMYHSVYADARAQGDMDRIVLWQDSMAMAAAVNPILGIGPGDYMAYSKKYGTLWYGENTYTNAHSNYAQMIAEVGYLGFFAFLWLVVAGIRTGIRCVKRVPADLKWFALASTAIFSAMAFSALVGDYLLPSRTNGGLNSFGTAVFSWLLLGASVAAVRLSKDEPVPIEEDEPAMELVR